jgi:hypothetical protein
MNDATEASASVHFCADPGAICLTLVAMCPPRAVMDRRMYRPGGRRELADDFPARMVSTPAGRVRAKTL